MNALILFVVLLFVSEGDLPPEADRNRFPDRGTAVTQRIKWEQHLKLLSSLRPYHPEDGRFAAWVAQTEFQRRYWELLEWSHDTDLDRGENWVRRQLDAMRKHIGWGAYLGGWFPELLPEEYDPEHVFEPKPMPVVCD